MVLIISGTNRTQSRSLEVAEWYKRALHILGIDADILNLQDLPTDFVFSALYNNEGKNEAFDELLDMFLTARAYVFIVPEYNGSFPGVLKAFIDGIPYQSDFTGKVAALVGLSAGTMGNALGLSHLASVLNHMGLDVLGVTVRLGSIDKHFIDGEITNKTYLDWLTKQMERLKFMLSQNNEAV